MAYLFYINKNMDDYFSFLETLIDNGYDIKLLVDCLEADITYSIKNSYDDILAYGLKEQRFEDSYIYKKTEFIKELNDYKLSKCYEFCEYFMMDIRKKKLEELDYKWLDDVVKDKDNFGDFYYELDNNYNFHLVLKKDKMTLERFIQIYKLAYVKKNSMYLSGLKDQISCFRVCHCIYDMSYLEKMDICDDGFFRGILCIEINNFNREVYDFIRNMDYSRVSYNISKNGKNILVSHAGSEITVDDIFYETFAEIEGFTDFGPTGLLW